MKKLFLVSILLIVSMLISWTVFAKDIVQKTFWYETDFLDVNYKFTSGIHKLYDEDTNVVCYAIINGNGNSISCLKNI